MDDTHTPASYWIIVNDSKGLITKKRKIIFLIKEYILEHQGQEKVIY